jgi:hypothetical protein
VTAVKRPERRITSVTAAVLLTWVTPAAAQTDYYNTDAGRPLTIEDATPLERYAFEAQLAPLRLTRAGGTYTWAIEPELAFGIAPRTQLEVGIPWLLSDSPDGRSGLGGLEIAMLHAVNVESRTVPALAIGVAAALPTGSLGPSEALATIKAIVTRSTSAGRVHLNAAVTGGHASSDDDATDEARWMAGIAIDRAIPLRSILVAAELFAEQPMFVGSALQWNAGAGVRWQRAPRLALDAGAGLRLSGDGRRWYATFGAAYAFALRSFIPMREGSR